MPRTRSGDDPSSTAGTTLTAMVWTGTQLALVHIGDSRAYLLRDGELFRITHDHTLVQSLVDEGRLTEEEAASHPHRTLLLRALLPDGSLPTPDLRLQSPRRGRPVPAVLGRPVRGWPTPATSATPWPACRNRTRPRAR